MWMDHRAEKQAKFINKMNHDVLKYVGGNISLEMQPPKLLWLKENMYEKCWKRAHHFFDLPDFLTWKATGNPTRSMCSVVCKWTYSPQSGWNKQFWSDIGLGELTADNFSKIGSQVLNIGGCVGGVCKKCHEECNLEVETPVAVSVLDAHCGGIGTIACNVAGWGLPCDQDKITDRIALVCGTSSCHMAISESPLFVPGVWGPYFSAMIPRYWLNEGGQSAVASLLEHTVKSHVAIAELKKISDASGKHIYACLNEVLSEYVKEINSTCIDSLTTDLHMLPDFHGNRSPLADPKMKGMISGLDLDKSLHGLALLYLACIQALALGTKHILDTLASNGHEIKAIFMTGGLQKNDIFVQVHANVTGLPVVLGRETETVLLGAAVIACCASKKWTMMETAKKMCHIGKVVEPMVACGSFYKKKYEIFLLMLKHQKEYRAIMETACN